MWARLPLGSLGLGLYLLSCSSVPADVSPFLCCRAAISRDPFYEMLAARTKKVSSTKRH